MKKKYITLKSKNYSLLDNNTGEILDYSEVKKVTLEDFIMVFFSSYPEIMRLEGQKMKVLMLCWKLSTFGGKESGNIIINDQEFKRRVREYEPNMSDSNIDACFSVLVKKGLLVRICKGRYELNPTYFFKGALSSRSHLMFSVEVDPSIEIMGENSKKSDKCFFIKSLTIYRKEERQPSNPSV